ncbi:MAG: S8/S53 family peptidase [Thermoplasmatota archaeon]
MRFLLIMILAATAFAGCVDSDDPEPTTALPPADPSGGFEPHVIVGVPDSGINPYHEQFYRPDRVDHPCTYIEAFPCDIPALNLTVSRDVDLTWEERFEADRATWESVQPGDVYWIPQTVFIGAICESLFDSTGICILDDTNMHGTGTTSSVLSENPDALIVFKEGGSSIEPILNSGIPVDIFSVSWGTIVPIPVGGQEVFGRVYSPIYILAAGNDPRSVLLDSWAGSTRAITVGGAYGDNTQEPLAGQQGDVVSYFCRPTAQTMSLEEMRPSYCGTSFATPTTAGGISKVVLAIREASGYTGTTVDDLVDPVAGISVDELKEAVFRTASYEPENQYPGAGTGELPLNPVAPWVQWGWGFYDGLVANATIDHFFVEPAPAKPDAAVTYMGALYTARETLHG